MRHEIITTKVDLRPELTCKKVTPGNKSVFSEVVCKANFEVRNAGLTIHWSNKFTLSEAICRTNRHLKQIKPRKVRDAKGCKGEILVGVLGNWPSLHGVPREGFKKLKHVE